MPVSLSLSLPDSTIQVNLNKLCGVGVLVHVPPD